MVHPKPPTLNLSYNMYRDQLGSGSYARVVKATERNSGALFALKIARVSLRIARTILRHEARVLQHLQTQAQAPGHRAVPKVFGYGREHHFEYLAMELLGPCLWEKIGEENRTVLQLGTVVRLGQQLLSALEYLAAHDIVHRDIKPDNILVCPADPTRVVLIDFGVAYHNPHRAESDDVQQEVRYACGSPYWCSVRAHEGCGPHPQDDLETLAFVLIFLSQGELPWMSRSCSETVPLARIQTAKERLTSSALDGIVPPEFAAILDSARLQPPAPATDIQPILTKLRVQMDRLAASLGEVDTAPLDWTTKPMSDELGQLRFHADETGTEAGSCTSSWQSWKDARKVYENSYGGLDMDAWAITYERSPSLTFPPDEAALLDAQLADIAEVTQLFPW